MSQKIDRTFMKAMDQIDTLQKAFAKGGNFETAILEIGGNTEIFDELHQAFDSLYDSLESAHFDAVGHMQEGMAKPTRHMTLAEAPFDGPRVGRKLQSMAVKEPNDMIANAMANLADHLEDWGTSFGPKSMQDLVRKTGLTAEVIKMLVQRAANKVQEGAHGKKKKYNESSYLKGDPYDRAEAHEEQARYHEDEAAAAKNGGDNVEAMYHREAYQAHMKAAAYLDKHIEKRDSGMSTILNNVHSQRAHEATEKANSFGESLEEVEKIDEASLYDKIKAARANPSPDKPVRGRGSKNRNPKTYDPRKALDKEDDRIQATIKKSLKKEEVELDEAKKPSAPKPRDPNSQYMNDLRKSGAMGAHKDKKKLDTMPRKAKHKGKAFESMENSELDKLFEEIKLELKLRGM